MSLVSCYNLFQISSTAFQLSMPARSLRVHLVGDIDDFLVGQGHLGQAVRQQQHVAFSL